MFKLNLTRLQNNSVVCQRKDRAPKISYSFFKISIYGSYDSLILSYVWYYSVINRTSQDFDYFKIFYYFYSTKCRSFFLRLVLWEIFSSSSTTMSGTTNSTVPSSVSRFDMFLMFLEARIIKKLVSQITLTNYHTCPN